MALKVKLFERKSGGLCQSGSPGTYEHVPGESIEAFEERVNAFIIDRSHDCRDIVFPEKDVVCICYEVYKNYEGV